MSLRLLLTILIWAMPFSAIAQDATRKSMVEAWNMYSRLNGVPPGPSKRRAIAKKLDEGKLREAALMSFDEQFYNVTLKLMFTEMTNEAISRRLDLNDFTATVIGMTRDDRPFTEALYSDVVYMFDDSTLPEKSWSNNDHYRVAQERGLNAFRGLVAKKQSEVSTIPEDATSGLLTTQAYGNAFFLAGTNRAVTRYTFMNFMCRDMEEMHDNTRPDHRVRQDVTRSPGGDTAVFRSKCAGCHAGMDGLTGATAYYDYTPERGFVYDPGQIPDKFFRDETNFIKGFRTADDSWVNLWAEGSNKDLGWHGAKEGRGLKSLGQMLSEADPFPECMAKRVLAEVCLSDDPLAINQLAHSFKANDRYNLKYLFAEAVLLCRYQK